MGSEIKEILCFVCNAGRLVLSSSNMDIPYFGEVVVTTFVCDRCGYRSTDVIPVRSRPPARFTSTVSGEDSLSLRVIRSSTGTVRIPELGVRIDPGTLSEGYITNAEGILNRVEAIIDQLLRQAYREIESGLGDDAHHGTVSRCLLLKDTIMAAREGRAKLTLILEDPMGNSGLAGKCQEIVTEPLTPQEVADLIRGMDR